MALPTWEQSSLLSRNDILDGESFSRSGIGLLNSTSSSSSNADLIKSLSRRPEFRIVEEVTARHVASKFSNEKSQAKLLSALDRALVDYDDSIISSNHPTRSFLGSKSQHSRFELEEYLQQEAGFPDRTKFFASFLPVTDVLQVKAPHKTKFMVAKWMKVYPMRGYCQQ